MKPKRKHYFGAGPAALPVPVLEEAAAAVQDFEGSGISILELAHRSPACLALLEEANHLIDILCDLRNEYHILWLPGGGRMQFAMLPQNLLAAGSIGCYIDSGYWSGEALRTAALLGHTQVVASSQEAQYLRLPDVSALELPDKAAYLHQTTNNTIFGTQFLAPFPDVAVPLVADMSSDLLGVPRNYRQYDLFYAVAQKNLGPAGITLVCLRKDLLPRMATGLPPMYSYRKHVEAQGVLNTLPVFPLYCCVLTLRWLAAQGLESVLDANERKARQLYEVLDRSPHFTAPVALDARSRMNVVFRGENAEEEARFLAHAHRCSIAGIEGHRSAGSFRASLYNGVPEASVRVLAQAIADFS